MSQTILQAVFWIATLAVLVLFLQRRRKKQQSELLTCGRADGIPRRRW